MRTLKNRTESDATTTSKGYWPNSENLVELYRIKKKSNKKNRFFFIKKRFVMINICEIVSCLMLIGLGTRYLIPNFNQYYSIPRIVFRIVNLTAQLMIPLISIRYCSICWQVLVKWKSAFFLRIRSLLYGES